MRFARSFVPSALLTITAALLIGAAAPRRGSHDSSPRDVALVRFDSLALSGVALNANGLIGRVLIFADGPARVGFGTAPLAVLADTIRLRSLPSFTVDVSQSDVHVQLVGGQLPRGGLLAIAGTVTGGPATRIAGAGRHLLILKGGTGIRVLDSAAR